MGQKQIPVIAQSDFVHRGKARSVGDVFEVGVVESIVLSRKNQVKRVPKNMRAEPVPPSIAKRRGTYRRRDMTAE